MLGRPRRAGTDRAAARLAARARHTGHRRPHRDTSERLEYASELARQLSVGIENVQLARGHPAAAAPAGGHVQLARRSRRRHRRALRVVQTNEAFASDSGRARADLLEHSSQSSSAPSSPSWAAAPDLTDPAIATRMPACARARSRTPGSTGRSPHGDAAHQRGRRTGRERARRRATSRGRRGSRPSARRCASGSRSRKSSRRSASSSPASRTK